MSETRVKNLHIYIFIYILVVHNRLSFSSGWRAGVHKQARGGGASDLTSHVTGGQGEGRTRGRGRRKMRQSRRGRNMRKGQVGKRRRVGIRGTEGRQKKWWCEWGIWKN